MKVVSVALSLVFAAGFIQTAAGLRCESQCAACWKIGSPGIDLKMICQRGDCGETCPAGYNNMHCAKARRCACPINDCGILGPCACGIETSASGKWKWCKYPSDQASWTCDSSSGAM